jgi:hypothetical protein
MHLKSAFLTTMATVAVAIGLAAPGPALAATTQQFHAVSGDTCRYGQTDGTLSWWSATTPGAVDVVGTVIDRPTPTDPSVCTDDRRLSFALFTAYAGGLLVDTERQGVDNGRLDFRFVLGATSSTARVDKVVVQVCRESTISPTQPVYCGPAQTYSPLSTTP